MFDRMWLSKCGEQKIEKWSASLLSYSWVLNFLFSITIESSKNDALEVAIFPFWVVTLRDI